MKVSIKFMIYVVIAYFLFASTSVLAKENTCHPLLNGSWVNNSNSLCENRTFDLRDLIALTLNFDSSNCSIVNFYCNGADINKDGIVNGNDLKVVTVNFCTENCTNVCVASTEVCDFVDNDCDGLIDDNCSVLVVCGDKVCNGAESCSSCASDCGSCPIPPPVVPPNNGGGNNGGGGGGAPRAPHSSDAKIMLNISASNDTIDSDLELEKEKSMLASDGESENSDGSKDVGVLDERSNKSNINIAGSKSKGVAGTGFATSELDGKQQSYKVMMIILGVVLIILISIIVYLTRKRNIRNNSANSSKTKKKFR